MTVDSSVTPEQLPRAGATGALQIQLAMLTALAGGLLSLGSYLGSVALLAAIGVVQLLLILSWLFGTSVPGRMGGLVLAVLAAAGA
ncbi:MAG: hypothetical protein QOE53_901, partial [Pseudonocardiales bacterium]|nr:hypothetical protein [Pseudonocardiales bacterium]